MTAHKPIKLVFGGGFFGYIETNPKPAQEVLDLLTQLQVTTIDTAKIYGVSEELLGQLKASETFTIDTKHPGGAEPGTATESGVVEVGLASLERLKTKKVGMTILAGVHIASIRPLTYDAISDIYYIHAPDATVPLESTAAGINELYKRGAFARFGISNYTPEEVQSLYDICKRKGYVLPTVYQGNYNAVARNYDNTLLPVLRKLGIAFYAYSPSAGGFLSKTKQQIVDGAGRFQNGDALGKMYSTLYKKPALMDALTEWAEIAQTENAKPTELAYRWLVYNSMLSPEHGDAIIFGSRTREQIKETVEWVRKGPLSEDTSKKIDEVWEKVKHEAPTTNFEAMG